MASSETPLGTVENTKEVLLSDADILKALDGKGPLKDLMGYVENLTRSSTPDTLISSQALEEVFEKLKENSNTSGLMENNKERIRSVIARAYALEEWKHIKAQGEEMIKTNKDSKIGYKQFEAFEKRLKTAPLGQTVEQISAQIATPGMDSEGAEKVADVITIINDTIKDNGPDSKGIAKKVNEWADKLPDQTPRAKTRKEASVEIAKAMSKVITSKEEELLNMPKYVQQNMAPYKLLGIPVYGLRRGQVWLSKIGAARGIEAATTFMETSSLVTASSFILAAAMATPLTITPSSNPAAWVAAATVAFTAFASQSYIFKQRTETALVEAKSKTRALAGVIAKNPTRALITTGSTFAIFLALVNADKNVERAQDIAALIEPNRAAIEEELNQVTQPGGEEKAASQLFNWITSLIPSGDGADTSEYALLNDAAEIPDELRRRMEIAVRAESGDSAAQKLAKNWNIPYSSTAGLGPKALSLAALVGISVSDAESLTGHEAMTAGKITPKIEKARNQIRAFAEKNNITLTDDQMVNPQFVMNALVVQFQEEALPLFSEFTDQRSELTGILRETAAMTILDSLYSTFFKFQPPVDPKEIPFRLTNLKDAAKQITEQYNKRLADPAKELSLIVANGIKSVYGGNVNVNEISIAPPPLKLDFTEIEKLTEIIQNATNDITAGDVNVSKNLDTAEDELDADLVSIDTRLANVMDILDPRNEIDEIVSRRYGDDLSESERQSRVGYEVLKNATLALSLEFIALLTMLGGSAGRLKEMEKLHGKKQSERIAKIEDKIVKAFTQKVNGLLNKYKELVNSQKKNNIDLVFPFEAVTEIDVKRALRTVGQKSFIKMGWMEKAVARGPYLSNIDTSNRYSDFLHSLGSPKSNAMVLDELFPGFATVLGYFNRTNDDKKSGHKKGERWLKPREVDPRKDKRVCEIAVLAEQNRRSELDLEIHEVLLEHLKGSIFGKRTIQNETELLPNEAEKMKGSLNLYESEWKDLIFASQDGSVLDDLSRRMNEEQSKIKKRAKRIEKIYSDLESNPIFGRTLDVENRIEGVFRPGKLTVLPRKVIESEIKNLLDGQSKGKQRAPFNSFDGYVGGLLKKLEGARTIEEKGINTKTVENADKQLKLIQEVIEETKNGFLNAVRKNINPSYRVETNIKFSTTGGTLRLNVSDGKKKIATEEFQISDIFIRGLSDESKNNKEAIAKELVGSNSWKQIIDKNFTFKPNHNIQTPLLKTYNALWEKIQDSVELSSSDVLREEIKAALKERKQDSIPVTLAKKGLSAGDAAEGIRKGMQAYLGHREMKRTISNVNLATASSSQLQAIKDALNQRRTAVRLTEDGDIRQEELERFAELLSTTPELSEVTATFDFMTQKFKVQQKSGMNIRNRIGRTMDAGKFAEFIQELRGL